MFTKKGKNTYYTAHTARGCNIEKRQNINKNTNKRVAQSKSILDICNESVGGRGGETKKGTERWGGRKNY